MSSDAIGGSTNVTAMRVVEVRVTPMSNVALTISQKYSGKKVLEDSERICCTRHFCRRGVFFPSGTQLLSSSFHNPPTTY